MKYSMQQTPQEGSRTIIQMKTCKDNKNRHTYST